MKNELMKNEIVKLGIILFIITAVAGICLSMANYVTKDIIAEANERATSGPEIANKVVPGSVKMETFDKALDEKIKKEYDKFIDIKVCKDKSGNELGYAIRTLSTVKGYGGDIELLVGISKEGKILGVEVTSHSETVGLGANVTKDSFKNQFVDKDSTTSFQASKSPQADGDIQAIGGATFSSKSFTSAINNACEIFNKYLK